MGPPSLCNLCINDVLWSLSLRQMLRGSPRVPTPAPILPASHSLANIPHEADEFVTVMSPSPRCSPGVRDNDAVTRAGADTRSFY